MATHDERSTVHFSDGEGVVHGDFIAMQQLAQRKLYDQLMAPLHRDPGNVALAYLRPADTGLSILETGTPDGNVNIQPGALLWEQSSDPGTPQPKFFHHYLDSSQALAVSAGGGGIERWDILSAKVEEVEGDSTTRDFKDAVTGALSTPSTNKRVRTRLTLTLTEGTVDQTEPSVPSGEVKFARIVVPATSTVIRNEPDGTNGYIIDMRKPLGYRVDKLNLNGIFYQDSGSTWGQSIGSSPALAGPGVNDILYLPIHLPATRPPGWHRLRQIKILSDLAATVNVRLYRKIPGGVRMELVDVSSQITAGGGPNFDTIIFSETSVVGAVWTNGTPNPWATPGNAGSYLELAIVAQDTNDIVYDVQPEFWGM